ncbi:T cell receptor alpha chain [Yersinia pseudotuberculosis]|uniref:T cell receptor alpha chain n=1 Tax=Yersinia pseudotuberculosis TaxID=633 RepID=A0ABN5R5Q1_YERPU|nr:T cell receptor alpha chain [Yersinia pseudotuberculosis]
MVIRYFGHQNRFHHNSSCQESAVLVDGFTDGEVIQHKKTAPARNRLKTHCRYYLPQPQPQPKNTAV